MGVACKHNEDGSVNIMDRVTVKDGTIDLRAKVDGSRSAWNDMKMRNKAILCEKRAMDRQRTRSVDTKVSRSRKHVKVKSYSGYKKKIW